jgi:hypothetical protein
MAALNADGQHGVWRYANARRFGDFGGPCARRRREEFTEAEMKMNRRFELEHT